MTRANILACSILLFLIAKIKQQRVKGWMLRHIW
jgi:hypothetical protein